MKASEKFSLIGTWQLCIYLIVALTICLWQYFGVPIHDDFCYMRIVPDSAAENFWKGYGEPISNFQDVVTSSLNHYNHVNGRLTNIIMISTVLLPRWLTSMLIGLAVGLMLFLIVKTSVGFNNYKVLPVILAALMIWIWFPWNDRMLSQDYSINYIIPSVAILIYGYFFLSKDSLPLIYFLPALLISLLVGLLHEGFSLPCFGASLILLVLYKRNKAQRSLLILALLIGIIVSVFSPSTLERLAIKEETDGLGLEISYFRNSFVTLLIPLVLTVFSFLIFLLKTKKFPQIRNEKDIFWVTIFFISYLIALFFNGNGRLCWLPALCLLIFTLKLLNHIIVAGKINYLISGILSAFLILFSCLFIIQEKRVGDSQRKLISLLKANSSGIAFVDLIPQEDIPWWTFGMVQPYLTGVSEMGLYTNGYHFDRQPLILPEAYKGKPFEQWEKLPGDNPFRGAQGYWYSAKKLEHSTPFVAYFGEKSKNAIPFFPTKKTYKGKIGDEAIVLIDDADTLFIYCLDLPRKRELLRLDILSRDEL